MVYCKINVDGIDTFRMVNYFAASKVHSLAIEIYVNRLAYVGIVVGIAVDASETFGGQDIFSFLF